MKLRKYRVLGGILGMASGQIFEATPKSVRESGMLGIKVEEVQDLEAGEKVLGDPQKTAGEPPTSKSGDTPTPKPAGTPSQPATAKASGTPSQPATAKAAVTPKA